MKRVARWVTFAKALVAEAEAGSVVAIKEIGDRLDGRVPQALR